MEKKSLTIQCPPDCSTRLDRFLTKHLDGSRSQVEKLIKQGSVRIDGKPVTKAGFRLSGGMRVECELPQPSEKEAVSVDFDVDILYEDEDILVLNKPSGVVVHPAPSVTDATLVDWLIAKGVSLSTLSGETRHGIVHRLDKETSGAMVVAKNNRSHAVLADQLKDRTMGRYYIALIDLPLKEDLTVDAPIGRNPANRLKMGIVSGGRSARTDFKKLLTDPVRRIELIGAKLHSGRTHQIRVHLGTLQRHILGDYLYGFKSKKDRIERILLHAYILYLVHPTTGETMLFKAPVPQDMRERMEQLFAKEKLDEVLDTDPFLRRFGDDRRGMFYQKPHHQSADPDCQV